MRGAASGVAGFVAAHRIGASRVFAVAFFAVALATASAHEDSVTSAALFVFGIALAGLASVGRLWCGLYISGYKNAELITTGPYSMCRNPLYMFSILGFAGVGFASETFTLGVVLLAAALMLYPLVIAHEEASLRQRFGERFERYCRETPRRLLPRPSDLREPDTYTVDPRRFRRAMLDALWFVWLAALLEIVEALHELHIVEPLWRLP